MNTTATPVATSETAASVAEALQQQEAAHADWFAQHDSTGALAPISDASTEVLMAAMQTAPSEFLRGWCAALAVQSITRELLS